MAMHPDLLTSAAIPETGPDAALIAACNAFAAMEIERQHPDCTDQEDDALMPAREAAFDRMVELCGTTNEAHSARARALALYQCPDCDEHGWWPSGMLHALLRDMTTGATP